ncbi:MAG: hypothetical protein AAF726_16600 [Planctomycetota bacterium]
MTNRLPLSLLAVLSTGAIAHGQVAYGTDDTAGNDNHLYNTSSDTSTVGLWMNGECWALADDDVNSVMYVGDGATLLAWPYNDAAPPTNVGTFNDAGRTLVPIGLGYDNGVLLGFDNDSLGLEGFWDVDVVTGDATLAYAVSTTSAEFGGVDIDPATGLIYCSNDSTTYVDTSGTAGRGIVAVDTVMGTETIVGPYPGTVIDIDGLAFDPAGVVWMLEDNPAPLHNYDLGTMMYDPMPPMNTIPASEIFSGGTWTPGYTPIGDGLGTNYCMANANSTGVAAVMSADGSSAAADNDVTLMAENLPAFAFSFFLTSQMQDFVMNPGGSSGNLCLGGNIGRYVGPGQVQNSGMAGTVSLVLDLTNTPTPTGPTSIVAGETWNFQCWFRDTDGAGATTSNFSDGLEIMFN